MKEAIYMLLTGCLAGLITLSVPAQSTRHALVIGNDTYEGNPLRNARSDAKAVAATLKQLGYVTMLALDADRTSMYRTVDMFDATLRSGDTVVFYYAGHGVQVEGENYLIPTNFHVADSSDVIDQGFGLSTLLRKLIEHGATTQIVILDACRNNPFAPVRGVSGGWAGMSTSAGTFLAFGTSPGATASDESPGGHGLFTMSLLKYMASPSLGIEQMFQQVRQDVIARSGGRQIPWTASSLVGSFHISPAEDDHAPSLAGTYMPDLRSAGVIAGTRGEIGVVRKDEEVAEAVRKRKLLDDAGAELRGFRINEAITILKDLLLIDPRSAIVLRLLGVALHLGGQNREAVSVLDAAVKLDSGDGDALSLRCLVLATQAWSSATRDCERSLSVYGENPQAHLGLAIKLYTDGRFAEAQKEAGKAAALDPGAPAIHTLRGVIASAQNESEMAQQEFFKATRLALSSEAETQKTELPTIVSTSRMGRTRDR